MCTERRLDFEKRRKLHYNEFEALKLARKLMEEDEEEDDEDTVKRDSQSEQAFVSGSKSDGKNEIEMDNEHS